MEFALTCVVEPQNECGRVIAKFRQGSIIKVDDLCNEDRAKFEGEDYIFVISHDCDITATVSKEPNIEVLTLQILNEGEQDSSLIYGKSPREIHLPVTINNVPKHLKLSQLTKTYIDKQKNINISADRSLQLDSKNLKLLQSWLSSRYKRHSFPEALADRLAKLQNKIESNCKKPSKSSGVIALFINADPWDEELEDDCPYEIEIVVVYESEISGAETNAQNLAQEISTFLEQVKKDFPDSLDGKVSVRSDIEFTLKDMRSYVEWRFEHLSFRGEIVGSTVD